MFLTVIEDMIHKNMLLLVSQLLNLFNLISGKYYNRESSHVLFHTTKDSHIGVIRDKQFNFNVIYHSPGTLAILARITIQSIHPCPKVLHEKR